MRLGTTSIVRATLGLGSVAGVSTAVGVPVALNVKSQTDDISAKSGISQISIDKCEFQDNKEKVAVDFGDTSLRKACGTVENDTINTNSELARDQDYTQLFQNMGHDRNGSGSSGSRYGTTSCNNSKGIFKSHVSGGVSLGLCDDSPPSNHGLMIQNDDKTTIKVCSGDCFSSESVPGGKMLNSFNKTGSWKEIKFYTSS